MGFKYVNKLWSTRRIGPKKIQLEQVGGPRVLLVDELGVHECATADSESSKRGDPLALFDTSPATLVRLEAYLAGDAKAVAPETFGK